MKPRLFIVSTTEKLEIAKMVGQYFKSLAEVTLWSDGSVFLPNKVFIETLFRISQETDFAVVVFDPDDVTKIRERKARSVRDNVLFEMGLFTGALGRNRCFAIKPRGINMRIPSDLEGVCFAEYYPEDAAGLEAAVQAACEKLWLAMEDSLQHTCLFLARYVAQEEPPLGDENNPRVAVERAYQLLLYMFRTQAFDSFCALDLAFHRWSEILGVGTAEKDGDRLPLGQTVNVSSEILNACDKLLAKGSCKSFRRILVVEENALRLVSSQEVLSKFQEIEDEWRERWPNLAVETRVLPWSSKRNEGIRNRIARLHDFAIFEAGIQNLAIVETPLTGPTDRPVRSECEIHSDAERVKRLRREFDHLWDVDAKPIHQMLEALKPKSGADPVPELTSHSSPADRARKHFTEHHQDHRSPCAVVIEAGYIDQRTPEDKDRFGHIKDALWLRAEINPLLQVSDRIFMETFINNLTGQPCGMECPSPPMTGKLAEHAEKWKQLLQRDHEAFSGMGEDWSVMLMKDTRKRFTNHLKKLVKTGHPALLMDDLDAPGQILVKTPKGKIAVAHYAPDGSGQIIARCAGLIAQHYHDLCQMADEKIEGLQDVWIFDFSRTTEALSVQSGAAVAAHLFSWRAGLRVRIGNAIYPPASGGPSEFSMLMFP